MNRALGKLASLIFRLRPEEFIALASLIPSWLITLKANHDFVESGLTIPRKYSGGIARLAVTAVVMGAFFYFVKKKPLWTHLHWLRDVMPFVFCVAIYTNLHDTIHFVNPHDIHDTLMAVDHAVFGVQPVLWAQRFYHPWLTNYFSISYMNYFLIAVTVVVVLLVTGRHQEMRQALSGTILCFYIGYFLYILFPAAPPRLTLADQFTRDFSGSWLVAAQTRLVSISASSSRAAFPSLHCAVTLISLMYAFRFVRPVFYVLIVPGISLVAATIYLRHHYVVDIVAGFALAIVCFYLAPCGCAWWERHAAARTTPGSPSGSSLAGSQ